MSWLAWVDRTTGAIRYFLAGEEARLAARGYGEVTHELKTNVPAVATQSCSR